MESLSGREQQADEESTAGRVERGSADSSSLSVLHLTTSPDASFYNILIDSLEARGIHCETLAVPGRSDGKSELRNRSPLDYVRFLPQVRRRLASGEFDIVQANYGLTAPHALAQTSVPVVLSLWGSDVFGPFGWVSKSVAPYCDAVVVMSDRLGEQLSTEYTVIPHGISLEQFQPASKSEARAELGWEHDAHHVLFPSPVARAEKNFPRAKRIVRRTRDALTDPVVLQIPDGRVPHEQMPTLMNAADALLLTSRHEGFPNAVKEALACNLPVVSTDVGDVARRLEPVSPSVVSDNDDDLVTGLTEILRDGADSNGRQSVRDMSVDRVAQRHEGVYRDVLSE
jgi:glycosyltransferase involved in cell wall biosynthesis